MRPNWRTLILATISLTLLASTGRTATVKGKVYMAGRTTADVVVAVEGENFAGHPTPHVRLEHGHGEFVPHVLPILRGTIVEFVTPLMPCRLYSVSVDGRFNLARQAQEFKILKFDQVGAVEVRCEDHPDLVAYILVRSNPFFSVTSTSGDYSIEGMSEGTKSLELWFEGQMIGREEVSVEGDTVHLDFRIPESFEAAPVVNQKQNLVPK